LRIEKRIKGVEELILRAFLARDELNIVDEHGINVAIGFSKGIEIPLSNSLDELVRKVLGGQENDLGLRVIGEELLCHCRHQVGLAQASAPVNEERIETAPFLMSNGGAGRVSKLAVIPNHEALKVELGIDAEAFKLPLKSLVSSPSDSGVTTFTVTPFVRATCFAGLRSSGVLAARGSCAVVSTGNLEDSIRLNVAFHQQSVGVQWIPAPSAKAARSSSM
jgi:hypothetical protein